MASSSALSRKPHCRICNNLDYQGHQETDLEGNTLKLKFEFPELDRDCPFCRLLTLSIESVVDKDSWSDRVIDEADGKETHAPLSLRLEKDMPIIGRLRFLYEKANHTEAKVYSTGRSSLDIDTVRFSIDSRDEVCAILPALVTLPPVCEDVTLEYAASLVRQGQVGCSKFHGELPCSKQPSGFLPTRLISIGSEPGPIRLVETNAVTGPYATLSYCWGGAKPLSTTKANISVRRHHIPDSSFPILFCQAIQLARNLLIPYIWIDSLCIIQDSIEDWEAESERMSLYYKHGSINIAAGSPENPHKPLVKEIDKEWCPVSVDIHDPQGTSSVINVRRLPELMYSNRDLGPLFTRAWTFQESLFAPRSINFTPQGVIWSCWGREISSENYLDLTTRRALQSSRVLELNNVPLRDRWKILLDQYSCRLLTFPTDKLPAISGVAAELHEIYHCPYLAGHWYDDLPRSLLWIALKPLDSSQTPLPREYVAPSWSWASITQRLVLPLGQVSTDITLPYGAHLVDVHCNVPGKNPYGRVSSGFIDLRGKTIPIRVLCEEEDYHTTTPDWDFREDCALRKSGDSVSRAKIGEAISDFEASASCLYLASLTVSSNSNSLATRPLVTHYALVLGHSDQEQTSFSRVGLIESTSERAMELFEDAFERTVRII